MGDFTEFGPVLEGGKRNCLHVIAVDATLGNHRFGLTPVFYVGLYSTVRHLTAEVLRRGRILVGDKLIIDGS